MRGTCRCAVYRGIVSQCRTHGTLYHSYTRIQYRYVQYVVVDRSQSQTYCTSTVVRTTYYSNLVYITYQQVAQNKDTSAESAFESQCVLRTRHRAQKLGPHALSILVVKANALCAHLII